MVFIALCLTVTVLCWAATAVLVAVVWRGVRRVANKIPAALGADCLFLLQILPLLASAILLSLFVIPGFAAWEPEHTSERVNIWMAAASIFAVALVLVTLVRLYLELKVRPVIRADKPFVAVLGCLRPKVVLSDAARRILSREELQAVLRHEAAHIERRDNFRLAAARLISMLTFSPRCWREMEAARARMTEFAADYSAATDEGSALHLAQALVKIARDFSPPDFQFASSLVPGGGGIQERVLRLLRRSRGEPAGNLTHLVIIAGTVVVMVAMAALHHDLQYFCYLGLERLVSL